MQQQDFKPANLMLRKDGVVKIADFGEGEGLYCVVSNSW
jgi:serine/threonine protein kinase